MEIYVDSKADKVLSMAKEFRGKYKPAFEFNTFDRVYKTMDGFYAERHCPENASQVVYLMSPQEYMTLKEEGN